MSCDLCSLMDLRVNFQLVYLFTCCQDGLTTSKLLTCLAFQTKNWKPTLYEVMKLDDEKEENGVREKMVDWKDYKGKEGDIRG